MTGLATLAVVCALACLGAASASAAPLAVVGNLESDDVSLIDTATNQLVGDQIEAGDGPASVAITPDGRYAYVADVFGDTVAVIDTVNRQPVGAPIPVGDGPFGLAVTPDGSRVFVTDSFDTEVSVIETATNQVVGGVTLDGNPQGVAITPDGRFAYVTERLVGKPDGVVQVIDTETLKTVGDPIPGGEGPVGIEFTPDGRTAFVTDKESDEVLAIDTGTHEVTFIPLAGKSPRGIVVAPDGKKAFVVNLQSGSVSVIDTATNREVEEIEVGDEPQEIALAANGKTLYVTEAGPVFDPVAQVERINVATGTPVGVPIPLPGKFPSGIAITPDQSPIAAFAAPDVTAGSPASFSSASTDADGTIASYAWAFGDGGTAGGARPIHTYGAPGTYDASLTVVDNEGCGEEQVFTGRTAYCSGGASSVTHPVTAKAPPVTVAPRVEPSGPPSPPSNKFGVGRLVHNRKNGTARLQLTLPGAGSVFLFGRQVHAVNRKAKAAGSMWLTLHARVELNKRLKKTHRASVQVRITFTPDGGEPRTVYRTITLQRAPKKHHRH